MKRSRHWLALLAACTLGALVALLAVRGAGAKSSQSEFGPFGPQGPRMREQLWLLPSGDRRTSLRATVFRPAPKVAGMAAEIERHPMVVLNHGTSEWTRQSVSMPVYYWLSRWFVERGYVVVLPQRRGHGATGGDLVEARGTCADPDHFTSGLLATEDIAAVVAFMSKQDFVVPDGTLVAGVSTGGWASLALASRNVEGVRGVINFAGGRGGHAFGQPNAICGEAKLIEAAGRFGATARSPSLWLYSENDSFFGPDLARAMHAAWTASGGQAELRVLRSYGSDGHNLADDAAGWKLWGPALAGFIDGLPPPAPRTAVAEATASGLAVWMQRAAALWLPSAPSRQVARRN